MQETSGAALNAGTTTKAQQAARPVLMVLASTYPRWPDDHEPGFVHELCKRLSARFRVIAVVPDAPGADPSGVLDGVQVRRYRYAPKRLQTLVNNGGIVANLRRYPWKLLLVPGFVLGQYLAARRIMRQQPVDLIHAHWLIPQGLVARWLTRGRIPYLVTSHGGDLFGLRGPVLTRIKRKVAVSSAAMTVVSTAMREQAQRLSLRASEIAVIPMGVDMQTRFVPVNGYDRAPDQLLFVGRLVPKKGLHHLIAAMPGIIQARPQATLIIAGFGPEEQALQEQARRLRIASRIHFIGAQPQSELPALYRRASLLVAPFVRDESGNQEGLPVVLMEAIGCGCPAIVGEVAGIHDLLGDTVDAVCVQPEDTQSLIAAVVNALACPQQAQARARALRQTVVDRADWQAVANAYASIMERILAVKVRA